MVVRSEADVLLSFLRSPVPCTLVAHRLLSDQMGDKVCCEAEAR